MCVPAGSGERGAGSRLPASMRAHRSLRPPASLQQLSHFLISFFLSLLKRQAAGPPQPPWRAEKDALSSQVEATGQRSRSGAAARLGTEAGQLPGAGGAQGWAQSPPSGLGKLTKLEGPSSHTQEPQGGSDSPFPASTRVQVMPFSTTLSTAPAPPRQLCHVRPEDGSIYSAGRVGHVERCIWECLLFGLIQSLNPYPPPPGTGLETPSQRTLSFAETTFHLLRPLSSPRPPRPAQILCPEAASLESFKISDSPGPWVLVQCGGSAVWFPGGLINSPFSSPVSLTRPSFGDPNAWETGKPLRTALRPTPAGRCP